MGESIRLINKISNKCCIEGIKDIADESVDIVIADPPYNIGKDFGNDSDKQKLEDYIKWSQEWINEAIRVLKCSGTMYIYGFSEILAHLSVNIELDKRWLIWHYTNKNSPRLNFWQRSHESIICCWKDKNKRIFNLDDVREPYTDTFIKNAAGKKRKSTEGRFQRKIKGSTEGDVKENTKETVYVAHENGALPRDVIKVGALAGGAGKKEKISMEGEDGSMIFHPTQKPFELTRRLIRAARLQSGGIILIPFAGSGSECLVANEMGCDFIGFEINEKYVELGNKALTNL